MKKLLTRLALLMILCAALALPVFADAVTDSISVCIGYFGWSEDEYVEKAKFSWQELDDWYGGALDTHEEYYSYCNGSGRTYLAFARGFYIRDLLDYAGVDVNSIASIDFFTKDHSVGAYRSFTKYALLDQPRYYFPNLAGDAETGELYAWDGGDDLWVGAYQVEPMLALEDYTEWDTAGFDFESYADESLFSTGSRFHLFFGQASPEEAATSSAAKYVYKILVTFSGTPVLSSEESNLDLVVGSDHALHVTADAEDDALTAYVQEHLQSASSDPAVVSVDQYGRLHVNAEGDAVITASFGESSVSVQVHVGSGGADLLHHRGVLLKVAVVGAADEQTGVGGAELLRRQLRHAGLGPQQIQGQALLRHSAHEMGGKFNARRLLFQRRAQHGRALDDADAVRQHQIRAVDSPHGRRVLPADLHDLRIGGHHIVGPLRMEQADALVHRFFHCQIIESNAQNVDPHEITSHDTHTVCIIS